VTTLLVSADDAELAVEVRGRGPPILFIHGFPFNRSLWRHQLAALSGWTGIAPDLRGAGASSAPAGGYSMARYADDLVRVLDALALDRAVVCGQSMGGYIMFELLRRRSDRVRAAVLCHTKAEPDTADAKRGRDEMAALAEREGTAAVADRLLPRLLAPATFAGQPEVVATVREMIEATPVPGLVGALRALRERPDSTATLSAIRVPALVVAGGDDQIAPPDGMRTMASAIAGAKFVQVSAAAHLAPLEQPLVTNRLLADFLGGLG
jgi:3-oxoadipate enol-lactonase